MRPIIFSLDLRLAGKLGSSVKRTSFNGSLVGGGYCAVSFTFEAIQVVFLFIVPGFITDQIIRLKQLRSQRDTNDTILAYIGWSSVNAVLASPLLFANATSRPVWWYTGRLLATLLLIPTLLGVVVAKAVSWAWWQKTLTWVGVAVHPHPKAWDHIFAQGKGHWVWVTLTDGTRVGGRFGRNSFASSFPHPEDIYIETVYLLDEDGWFLQPLSGTCGILIRGDKIAQIEFFEGRDTDVEQADDATTEAGSGQPRREERVPAKD